MNLIESILEELTDPTRSLAGPLLKTKVLAKTIGNEELFRWTDKELVGYREEEEKNIPPYRRAQCTISCGLQQGFGQAFDQPFPILLVKPEHRDYFLYFELMDGIQLLEEKASGKSGDMFGKEMSADMLAIINTQMLSSNSTLRVLQMSLRVHIGEAIQCLTVIRSRLLDFILELQQAFPEMEEHIKGRIELAPEQKTRLEQIIHQTIIHAGDNNTINTGTGNSFNS